MKTTTNNYSTLDEAQLDTTSKSNSLSPQRSAGRGLGRGATTRCAAVTRRHNDLLSPTLSSKGREGVFINSMVVVPGCSPLKGKLLLLALCLALPSLAQAHPLPGQSSSLLGGLAHPLSGLDHILAMVAVGLWAAQLGGRSIWLVPAAFVGFMSLGGVLALSGFSLPLVETGIAVSVLVLGILIATTARLPLAASMALVGLFAIFHGHAHGTEMQVGVSSLSYGLGFALATAGLHACGIGIGRLAQSSKTPLLRFAGIAIALVGLFLCLV